jgi:hypothetical protein
MRGRKKSVEIWSYANVFAVRASRVCIAFCLDHQNHVSSSCESHVNGASFVDQRLRSGSNLNTKAVDPHKRKFKQVKQIAFQFQKDENGSNGIIL